MIEKTITDHQPQLIWLYCMVCRIPTVTGCVFTRENQPE